MRCNRNSAISDTIYVDMSSCTVAPAVLALTRMVPSTDSLTNSTFQTVS